MFIIQSSHQQMRDLVRFWLAYADDILFITRTGERRRKRKERAEETRSETDRGHTIRATGEVTKRIIRSMDKTQS